MWSEMEPAFILSEKNPCGFWPASTDQEYRCVRAAHGSLCSPFTQAETLPLVAVRQSRPTDGRPRAARRGTVVRSLVALCHSYYSLGAHVLLSGSMSRVEDVSCSEHVGASRPGVEPHIGHENLQK